MFKVCRYRQFVYRTSGCLHVGCWGSTCQDNVVSNRDPCKQFIFRRNETRFPASFRSDVIIRRASSYGRRSTPRTGASLTFCQGNNNNNITNINVDFFSFQSCCSSKRPKVLEEDHVTSMSPSGHDWYWPMIIMQPELLIKGLQSTAVSRGFWGFRRLVDIVTLPHITWTWDGGIQQDKCWLKRRPESKLQITSLGSEEIFLETWWGCLLIYVSVVACGRYTRSVANQTECWHISAEDQWAMMSRLQVWPQNQAHVKHLPSAEQILNMLFVFPEVLESLLAQEYLRCKVQRWTEQICQSADLYFVAFSCFSFENLFSFVTCCFGSMCFSCCHNHLMWLPLYLSATPMMTWSTPPANLCI